MDSQSSLDRFLAASPYSHPVDLKKLRFIHDALVSHARAECAGQRVLEVGCGVGGITLPLASLGCRVTGVDLDEGDMAELRQRLAAQDIENVETVVGDALTFSADARYDAVVASEVFEHLDDPASLAAMIARQLKPGGLLIVTTPNGYGPWENVNSVRLIPRRWGWLRAAMGKPPHDGAGREHEQRYTRPRLVALFGDSGFRLTRWANSDFIFTVSRRLRAHAAVGALDCKLGDLVPHWMASGWYMTFTYDGGSE